MDEHNVHHFWGISPAIDLLAVAEAAELLSQPENTDLNHARAPISILQAASYDARHTLTTLCRLARHSAMQERPLHFYVYEEEPEGLIRHLLLISVLLDGSLLPKERMETLLELHGNALVRENTATYLEQKARQMETMLTSLGTNSSSNSSANSLQALLAKTNISKQSDASKPAPDQQQGTSAGQIAQPGNTQEPTASDGIQTLSQLLDISLLKFQDRDRLIDVLQQYRTTLQYDMVSAWDARARKWYAERYDVRRNMVDWDYHMRLIQAGTPGQPVEHGSIIHFHHFRHWRMHGVAYELRDARYNQPNRSLLSIAYGRTKEFKDRNGKDVGRSVSAKGWWGDCLNSPYHCWGTLAEEDAFYKYSNKQFTRTAIDIAEHNVLALLHELRTGQRMELNGQDAHRASVARGPTSMSDLQEDAAKTAQARQQHEQAHQAADNSSSEMKPPSLNGGSSVLETVEENEETENSAGLSTSGTERVITNGGTASKGNQDSSVSESQQAQSCAEASTTDSDDLFQPSATFQGRREGFSYKWGPQGMGYYQDKKQTKASQDIQQQEPQHQRHENSNSIQQSGIEAEQPVKNPSDTVIGDSASQQRQQQEPENGKEENNAITSSQMKQETEAVKAREAQLDAAAAARICGGKVRIIPILGSAPGTLHGASDLAKLLTGRAKYANYFHVISVGHRHIHLLNEEHKLQQAARTDSVLVVENAHNLLQLKTEQAAAFTEKVTELARKGGWTPAPEQLNNKLFKPVPGSTVGMTLTNAHVVYTRQ